MANEWKLRQVMAKNDIWSGSELIRLMEEKAGYTMSPASVSALLKGRPKLYRDETIDALCTALDCDINELIVHTPSYIGKVNKPDSLKAEKDVSKASGDRPLPPV